MEIIRWFREEQLSHRVCFQDEDSCIAPWFHGKFAMEKCGKFKTCKTDRKALHCVNKPQVLLKIQFYLN